MKYKIVMFDVDGTLLNTRRQLSNETISAVRQLRSHGVTSAIASARTPYNIGEWLQALQIDTYMVYNGCLVIHEGAVLHQEMIDPVMAHTLIDDAVRRRHSVMPEGLDRFSLISEQPDVIIDTYAKAWDHSRRVPYEDFHQPISQIDLFCASDEVAPYISAYSDLTFYPWVSRPNAFNVIPKGVSKARGFELILQKMGISREEAVAFGDGPNDLEMLTFAGTGVAMGNAVPELKNRASYVTRHVDDDGIAHGLRHLGII